MSQNLFPNLLKVPFPSQWNANYSLKFQIKGQGIVTEVGVDVKSIMEERES